MNLTLTFGWLEISMIALGSVTFLYAFWRWLKVQFFNSASELQLIKEELAGTAEQSLETYAFSHDAKIEALKAKLGLGLGTIAMIAGIAPMMGLLGTVSGMIETFQAMNSAGNSDLAVMSGGIAKALYTTELGLIIAVPLVILHAIIRQKINQIIVITEKGLMDGLLARS